MRTAVALLIALAPLALSAQPGDVVFTELMWMGSTASSADEWIELANRSDHPVDLTGWTIARGTGSEVETMVTIAGGTLDPGQTYLISNYAADDSRCRLSVKPDLVSASVSLPNSKLDLRLYAGDPASGAQLIDRADDGVGAPAGGDAKLKRAMVRVHLDGDGTQADNWGTADQASGWDQGATEMGTPGSIDLSVPVPPPAETKGASTAVHGTSWAILKSSRR